MLPATIGGLGGMPDAMVVLDPLTVWAEEKHPVFKEGDYRMRKVDFREYFDLDNVNLDYKCTGNTVLHQNANNPDATPVFEV